MNRHACLPSVLPVVFALTISAGETSPNSTSVATYPEGVIDNSPAFQRWAPDEAPQVPKGRPDALWFRPSLRDLLTAVGPFPSVETLGYSQTSLRDACADAALLVSANCSNPADKNVGDTADRNVSTTPLGHAPPATNVVIGLLLPPIEPQALSVRQGALLAVENWKANEHIPATLVIRGAVGQWGTDGVEAARMATDDGAQALIAPPDGAGSHLALQVSGRTAIPVISLCADSFITQTGVPWMVRITPRTSDEAKTIFSGLSSTTKTWIACVPDGRRGREITRDLADAAHASKITLPKTIQVKWPLVDLSTFSTVLLTNHTDGILLWLDSIPAASLLHSLRAAGFNGPVAGPSWLRCSDFENLAAAANGTFVMPSPVRDKASDEQFQDFANDFRSRFSREPDAMAAMSYDACQLLLQLLYRGNGRPAHESFPVDFSFPGVTGVLSFDSLGNRKVELELGQARNAHLGDITQTGQKR